MTHPISSLNQTPETEYSRYMRLLMSIGFVIAGIGFVFMAALLLGPAGVMAAPVLRRNQEEKNSDNSADLIQTGKGLMLPLSAEVESLRSRNAFFLYLPDGSMFVPRRVSYYEFPDFILREPDEWERVKEIARQYPDSKAVEKLAKLQKITQGFPKPAKFFSQGAYYIERLAYILKLPKEAGKFKLVEKYMPNWQALLEASYHYGLFNSPFSHSMYPVILEITETLYDYILYTVEADKSYDFNYIIKLLAITLHRIEDENKEAFKDISEDQFAKAMTIVFWFGNEEIYLRMPEPFKKGISDIIDASKERLFLRPEENRKVNKNNVPVGIAVIALFQHGNKIELNKLKNHYALFKPHLAIDPGTRVPVSLLTALSTRDELANNIFANVENLFLGEKKVNYRIKLTVELLKNIRMLEENTKKFNKDAFYLLKDFDKPVSDQLIRKVNEGTEILIQWVLARLNHNIYKQESMNQSHITNDEIENNYWLWLSISGVVTFAVALICNYQLKKMEQDKKRLEVQRNIEEYFNSSFRREAKQFLDKHKAAFADVIYIKEDNENSHNPETNSIPIKIKFNFLKYYQFLSRFQIENEKFLWEKLFFKMFKLQKISQLAMVESDSRSLVFKLNGHPEFWEAFIKRENKLSKKAILKLKKIYFYKFIEMAVAPKTQDLFDGFVHCEIDKNACVLSWNESSVKMGELNIESKPISPLIQYMLRLIFGFQHVNIVFRADDDYRKIHITLNEEYHYNFLSMRKAEECKDKMKRMIEIFSNMRKACSGVAEVDIVFDNNELGFRVKINNQNSQEFVRRYLLQECGFSEVTLEEGVLMAKKPSNPKNALPHLGMYIQECEKQKSLSDAAEGLRERQEKYLIDLNSLLPNSKGKKNLSWKNEGQNYTLLIEKSVLHFQDILVFMRFILSKNHINYEEKNENKGVRMVICKEDAHPILDSENNKELLRRLFCLKGIYVDARIKFLLIDNELFIQAEIEKEEIAIKGTACTAEQYLSAVSAHLKLSTASSQSKLLVFPFKNVELPSSDFNIVLQHQTGNQPEKKDDDRKKTEKEDKQEKKKFQKVVPLASAASSKGHKEKEKEEEKPKNRAREFKGTFFSVTKWQVRLDEHTTKLQDLIERFQSAQSELETCEESGLEVYEKKQLDALNQYCWIIQILTELYECYKDRPRKYYQLEPEWMTNIEGSDEDIMKLRIDILRSILEEDFAETVKEIAAIFRNENYCRLTKKRLPFKFDVSKYVPKKYSQKPDDNFLVDSILAFLKQLVEVKKISEKFHSQSNLPAGIVVGLRELVNMVQQEKLKNKLGTGLFNLLTNGKLMRNVIVHYSYVDPAEIDQFAHYVEEELNKLPSTGQAIEKAAFSQ